MGTVFKIDPTGDLTTLHSFVGPDGRRPQAALVEAADGSFYGTTQSGGPQGRGVVFRLGPMGNGPSFLRGDGNGNVNITDVVRDLRLCFSGESVPCAAACDADGDDNPCTGVTDGVRLLDYLFRDAAPLPPPFPDCGTVEREADCETPPVSCQ